MRLGAWIGRLSGGGLVLGILFFAASLTPTLVPRTYLTQGVLAGGCFAIGYAIGLFLDWLWGYVGLPRSDEKRRRLINLVIVAASALVALIVLRQAVEWQNSIRVLMAMPPLTSAHPVKTCLVAVATFIVFWLVAKAFVFVARAAARGIRRLLTPRVANVLGVVVAILLFWTIANDVLFRIALNALDFSFQQFDALLEPERAQPTAPEKTGSPASLLTWDGLGRAGREFIVSGPSAADISALTGRPAREPIRVYVGLRGAPTAEARAELALKELIRVGAFDRSILIAITPTGTGWVDPAALDAVEYLHDGDVASVALQYSYLSSPLSLIVQPERGAEAARALFVEIYRYWTKLPKDRRPKLYLHGLSLGALNSERSAQLFEMIGDPIDGALWSGPPFESRVWRSITDDRNPGSPAWKPLFRDGSFVRFMSQAGDVLPAGTPWGPLRIVYLQYASDPVTFFDYRDLYRPPAWLDAPRGPDVSPQLRWYPVVTLLQLAVDMAVGTATPVGFGHVYAPEHYVDAWIAVTDVKGWSAEAIERLKQHLAKKMSDDLSGTGDKDVYADRGG